MATMEGGTMMIPTLKDKLLATGPLIWRTKVTKILQFYWDEKSTEDLPRRFELLWEEIKTTPAFYQHNVLADFVAYNCILGERKEMTKRFAVYDEDVLVEEFQEIPVWDEIRLNEWEEGTGPLFDDLAHLDVVRLLIAQRTPLEPESSELHNLSLYLGARLPAYSECRQERIMLAFLAMLLDEYYGRIQRLPEPCETDRAFELKWGHLYSRISEYKALKKLREEILLDDI